MANLVRHVQSRNYYARIRVRGKLIWKSLKTDRIIVAKLRLGDFHKEERQRAAAHQAAARGKMTFAAALKAYRERLKGDYSLKDRSKAFREGRITALLKAWPDLEQTDVARISKTDCRTEAQSRPCRYRIRMDHPGFLRRTRPRCSAQSAMRLQAGVIAR